MMWFLMDISFKPLGAAAEDLIWKENNRIHD